MNNVPFPKVSEGQDIDNVAKEIFENIKPSTWFMNNVDGNNDFGIDFLVQVKDINIIKYNFFVQLKGIKSEYKITDEDIKTQIKASTLNYYRNNGLVVLVFCDVNERKCYYEFLHVILNKLNENKRYLDFSQETYLIRISKKQVLDKSLNIENILESYAHGVYDIHRKLTIMDDLKIDDSYEDNEQDYEEKRTVFNNQYINQKGRVYLDAFIPHDLSSSFSCLIKFKLSDAKNALITPDVKTILSKLFSGYKSKPNSTTRKWIVGKYENDFIIQIGETRLTVPLNTIIDLSDILDDLFEVYTSRINKIEKRIGAENFPVSSVYKEGFKLIKIKRGLLYYIHEFAEKHTFRKKDESEWNIFGYDKYFLRVNLKDKGFIWSGNMIFAPERYDGYNSYMVSDDEIVLTWDSLPQQEYEREQNFENIMSVYDAYKWLKDKLIPYVVYNLEKKRIEENYNQLTLLAKFFNVKKEKKELKYEDFMKTFDINKYIIFDYYEKSFSNEYSLEDKVNELQSFYHSQRNIFLDVTKLISLYEGVSLLFSKNFNRENLEYLHGNLNDLIIDGEYTSEKFIEAINRKISSLEEGTTNEFRVDLILRCYVVLVRENIEFYDKNFIQLIENKLQALVNHKRLLEIKERQLKRQK